MKNSFQFSIKGCARCKEDYEDLTAKPFTHPVEMVGEGIRFYHWATCPVTEEPIIVQGHPPKTDENSN
jgi:hypothetical protein